MSSSRQDPFADDPHFIDRDTLLTLERMLQLSGFSRAELIELVDHGAFGFELHETVVEQWRFPSHAALLARRARELRGAFELDASATSLVMGLLERIEELQRRMRDMEGRLLGDK